MKKMVIHVSIVEDDEGIRSTLQHLINQQADMYCDYVFPTAETAISLLRKGDADVILMDINLPHQSGIECTAILRQKMPGTQIIMLTVYEDSEKIFKSLKAGANGYLLKRTEPAQILASIREVYAGGSPMSSQIARKVVSYFATQSPVFGENSELDCLTAREQDILSYLAKGYRYQEIAEALFISVETVRTHLRHIYEKLQVRSRTEAVIKYLGQNQ